MKYRPDECPACGFVWGSFQGRRFGTGFEKLAANVWKCARCGHTARSPDARDRQVARL